MGTAYRHLGLLALAQGHWHTAQSLLRKSLDLFAGFITGWDVVRSLVYLGEATAVAGDPFEARRILGEARDLALEVRALPLAFEAMIGLAGLQARVGETEQALQLVGCVERHSASTHEIRERAVRLRAQLASQWA
jgi:ATP/maltotriose-dependent transcriptional regulator MalT